MKQSVIFVAQESEDARVALEAVQRELDAPETMHQVEPPSQAIARKVQSAAERLGGMLWELDARKSIDARAVIHSRRPAIGPAIIWGQRVVRRLTSWYLLPIVHRVEQFQREAAEAIRLTAELQDVRQELADARAAEVSAQVEAALARLSDEVGQVRAVQRDLLNHSRVLVRLDRLERLVQAIRLGGVDIPPDTVLGTRGLVGPAEGGFDYEAFEDRFRGSREQVRAQQAHLVDHFRGAPGPVVDLGCGRGEFLALLAEAGIDGYGVDESAELVAACRAAGLSAFRDGAVGHLGGQPDGYLGGILASHLIEHLAPNDLWQLFRLAAAKLAPGGVLVIETPNPRTLAVSGTSFWLDPTHQRPIHPDTARFLIEQAGFADIRLRAHTPFPDADRIPPPDPGLAGPVERALADLIDRLNDILYGDRDYTIVARVAPGPAPAAG